MKIAVCDDELTVREQVSDIIKTYFDERKRNAELTLYESGRKMIEDEEAYDIIFLDIEMARNKLGSRPQKHCGNGM